MAVGSWLGRTRGQGLHGKSRLNPQAQPSIHSTLFWYQGHHFPLNIYSLQGRELLCSSKPFHFPGQQEDYISCLLCSQIWPRDWVLSSRMYKPLPGLANKTTPCDPSAHSPLSAAAVEGTDWDGRAIIWTRPGSLHQCVEESCPGEFHLIHTRLYVRKKQTLVC